MRRLLVGVALALLPACGFTPPAMLACSDLAAARCARRDSCSNGTDITRTFGDMKTCLQREALQCMLGIGASATGSAPANVEQCAIAYRQVTCAELFNANLPPACTFVGTRGTGAPCAFSSLCASGYCSGNKTSNCGTCAVPPVAGTPCVHSNCGRSQTCDLHLQVCQDVLLAGMACDNTTVRCAAELACVGSSNGQMGTCMATLGDAGKPCGGTLGSCDPLRGLVCEGVTSAKSCLRIVYAGNGMPCGNLPNGMFAGCANGGQCYTTTGLVPNGGVGTCKSAAADGEACDIMLGPGCLLPARCVVSGGGTAGICTLPSSTSCG